MARGTTGTPEKAWRSAFLAAFAESGNVRSSCKVAGISRSQVYRTRDADPEFAAQWDEARDEAVDVLEAEAQRRALAGSDVLLIFLLKANRPAKYRETTRTELTGADGGPLVTEGLDDHERRALRAAIDAELARRAAPAGQG